MTREQAREIANAVGVIAHGGPERVEGGLICGEMAGKKRLTDALLAAFPDAPSADESLTETLKRDGYKFSKAPPDATFRGTRLYHDPALDAPGAPLMTPAPQSNESLASRSFVGAAMPNGMPCEYQGFPIALQGADARTAECFGRWFKATRHLHYDMENGVPVAVLRPAQPAPQSNEPRRDETPEWAVNAALSACHSPDGLSTPLIVRLARLLVETRRKALEEADKECASVRAKLVESERVRESQGRDGDARLWSFKADGAELCQNAILALRDRSPA